MNSIALDTKYIILGEEDRKKLATFLKEELGIEYVMYIFGEGHNIKIISKATSISEDEGNG